MSNINILPSITNENWPLYFSDGNPFETADIKYERHRKSLMLDALKQKLNDVPLDEINVMLL